MIEAYNNNSAYNRISPRGEQNVIMIKEVQSGNVITSGSSNMQYGKKKIKYYREENQVSLKVTCKQQLLIKYIAKAHKIN